MSLAGVETATERVVVLMTPRQKAEAKRRAANAHLSLADFMRKRVFSEDGAEDRMLIEMVRQLESSTTAAVSALDRALGHVEAVRKARGRTGAKARSDAEAEFSDVDPEAFADLLASRRAGRS